MVLKLISEVVYWWKCNVYTQKIWKGKWFIPLKTPASLKIGKIPWFMNQIVRGDIIQWTLYTV